MEDNAPWLYMWGPNIFGAKCAYTVCTWANPNPVVIPELRMSNIQIQIICAYAAVNRVKMKIVFDKKKKKCINSTTITIRK